MKFADMSPSEYQTARLDEIKRQIQAALEELHTAPYTWIVAARITRLSADLFEVVSGREWLRGYQAGIAPLAPPRIGGGVTITDGEVQ